MIADTASVLITIETQGVLQPVLQPAGRTDGGGGGDTEAAADRSRQQQQQQQSTNQQWPLLLKYV